MLNETAAGGLRWGTAGPRRGPWYRAHATPRHTIASQALKWHVPRPLFRCRASAAASVRSTMSDGFVAPAAVPPHMRRPAPVPPGARPVRPLPGADSPALLPRPQASATAPGLAQSTWEAYYDECHTVRVPAPCGGEDAFRVYVAGDAEGPVLVLLHGGGLSAMSYALATQSLKRKATVLALDFRGHGATETIDEADLSKDRLVADVAAVLRAFFEGRGGVPPLLLVGHSLGGAIAVWVAAERKELPVQVSLLVLFACFIVLF